MGPWGVEQCVRREKRRIRWNSKGAFGLGNMNPVACVRLRASAATPPSPSRCRAAPQPPRSVSRLPPRANASTAGKYMSTTLSAKLSAEGQTLKHSPGNNMLPSSSSSSTFSMAYPGSLCSLHQHHPNSEHSYFPISKPNHDNTHKYIESPKIPRRSLALLPASSLLLYASSSFARDANAPSTSAIDTTITDRVFMDFSICPSYFTSDRTLGAKLASCPDSETLGRVVFGLYGRLLPITTANFKATCTASAYRGALVHKLRQGQFFAAGHQEPRRDKGAVQPPSGLVSNAETVDPKAYQLRHARPGTLSLCLGQNDDDEGIKLNPNYHNVEFLVTTGPGPCPELDGQNIVFGTVLEGMDVITSIATIPTYKPAERIRFFNEFAQLIGDERAQTARAMWDRPQKTVYISNCGELKVTKPSLSPPSLP